MHLNTEGLAIGLFSSMVLPTLFASHKKSLHSQQEPVKRHWLVTQVPLENSVESHWKFSEIPLETSESLLETS